MSFQHAGQGPGEILVFLFLKTKQNKPKDKNDLRIQKDLREKKKFMPVLVSFPVAAEKQKQTITTTKTWQKQLGSQF